MTTPKRGRRPLGATINGNAYSRPVHTIRGEVRKILKKAIVDITNDPSASMRWTARAFHSYIFLKRGLRLTGWPLAVKFANLSQLGKPNLIQLLEALKSGVLHFVSITDKDRYAHPTNFTATAPGKFDSPGRSHPGRSDINKSRVDKKTGQLLSFRRGFRPRGAISPAYIDDEMDA